MSKKYIILKEQLDTTDDYPMKKSTVTTALAGKVAINQGTTAAGKFLVVGSDGNVTTGSPDAQVQVDWNSDTSGDVKTILNRPFKTIGTGLTVTDEDVLTADVQMHFEIFDELPTPSATYAQTIALILKAETETGNIYKEYACVNTTGSTWVWEQIGETQFELTITQNASGITINGTALQSATSGQKGLLTAADWATFNGKQDALTFDDAPTSGSANPVKSGGVYTALEGKVDVESGKSLVEDAKVTGYDNHLANNAIHVTAAQKEAWTAKQDAIAAGTSGNVVTYTGTAGSVGALGFDSAPTASSANLVKSGAIKTALDAKVTLHAGTVLLGHDTNGYYFEE